MTNELLLLFFMNCHGIELDKVNHYTGWQLQFSQSQMPPSPPVAISRVKLKFATGESQLPPYLVVAIGYFSPSVRCMQIVIEEMFAINLVILFFGLFI